VIGQEENAAVDSIRCVRFQLKIFYRLVFKTVLRKRG